MIEVAKTNNIYFPLCLLAYQERDLECEGSLFVPTLPQLANDIISFGIVEYAAKLSKDRFVFSSVDKLAFDKYIKSQKLKVENEFDKYIVLSALKLTIDIHNIEVIKSIHKTFTNYVNVFESEFGKDVRVKIHKDLLRDVRDKKLDERMFRVYCAIVSIIGKKQFVRITRKRIAIRMLGFKSEDVFDKLQANYKLLTDRQIETTVNNCQRRNLFDFVTYGKRLIFYSLNRSKSELAKLVIESIAKQKHSKDKKEIRNKLLKIESDKLAYNLNKDYAAKLSEAIAKTDLKY